MKFINRFTLPVIFLCCLIACDKEEDNSTDVVKQWDISMSTGNETNVPPNRTETGTARIELLRDNSLIFTFTVNGLLSTDNLTASHFHPGAPKVNGPVILPLASPITGNSASGTIANLRQSLVDSLKGNAQIYINVHSKDFPAGLVRGQLQ